MWIMIPFMEIGNVRKYNNSWVFEGWEVGKRNSAEQSLEMCLLSETTACELPISPCEHRSWRARGSRVPEGRTERSLPSLLADGSLN